jgi:hypothetical protein
MLTYVGMSCACVSTTQHTRAYNVNLCVFLQHNTLVQNKDYVAHDDARSIFTRFMKHYFRATLNVEHFPYHTGVYWGV